MLDFDLGLNASGRESEEGEGGGRPLVLLVRINLFQHMFSIGQEVFGQESFGQEFSPKKCGQDIGPVVLLLWINLLQSPCIITLIQHVF
jgi:hypothetical protein